VRTLPGTRRRRALARTSAGAGAPIVAAVHAAVIRDGHLVYEEHEDPVPGDTELLVEVRAAGINGADIAQRAGLYPAPPGWPQDIPGMEMAGEVVGTGRAVTRFSEGDRVMAVVGGGAQATLAYVDESHAVAVPDGLPWAEAGGFPEVFSTAYDALFAQAGLAMGERVLVSGAAGGVGTAGVQLAAAAGAVVVATVRDPDRRDAVAALGAAVVIAPGEEAAHGPYDVVLELVGASSLATTLPAVATGARIVVIGVGGGARMELNLFTLMGARASIGGSTLRARSRREKANVAEGVRAHVLPLLASGRVAVPVTATFPLAEAEAAYDRFSQGSKLGKVVLVP
jgi:NADPH:quinone reductase